MLWQCLCRMFCVSRCNMVNGFWNHCSEGRRQDQWFHRSHLQHYLLLHNILQKHGKTEAASNVHRRLAGLRYTLVTHWAHYHHITQYQPRGIGMVAGLRHTCDWYIRQWEMKESVISSSLQVHNEQKAEIVNWEVENTIFATVRHWNVGSQSQECGVHRWWKRPTLQRWRKHSV